MKFAINKVLLAALGFSLVSSLTFAQSAPLLIEPAKFGTVRDVLGMARLVAMPQPNCPSHLTMENSKICWQSTVLFMQTHRLDSAMVVGVEYTPTQGQVLAWGDVKLYAVKLEGERPTLGLQTLPISEVKVPRYCYELKGEAVTYVFEKRQTGSIAQERQRVVCDGGPKTASGPYYSEGPTIPSMAPETNQSAILSEPTFRATGQVLAEGSWRFLAYPDPACDKANIVRDTLCAAYPIARLSASGDKEADMIGAKRPVQEGDRLYDDDVDQLVLKKKSKGFKADKRWFSKSFYNDEAGCRAIEGRYYRVKSAENALWVTEQALNQCGAPPAPTPADIYEAYGRDMFILYCDDDRHHRFERHKDNNGKDQGVGRCFEQARDYLIRNRLSSDRFVVLNDRARVDDRLFSGGYVSYDVAEVSLDRDAKLEVRRLDDYEPSDIYMSRCSALNGGRSDSKGFVIVRSMGIQWARPYRYMSCPIW